MLRYLGRHKIISLIIRLYLYVNRSDIVDGLSVLCFYADLCRLLFALNNIYLVSNAFFHNEKLCCFQAIGMLS